jgi:hypothetical protein
MLVAVLYFSFLHSLVRGGARTPHSAPPRSEDFFIFVIVDRPRAGYWGHISFVFPRPHIPSGWMALSREINKKINTVMIDYRCCDGDTFNSSRL